MVAEYVVITSAQGLHFSSSFLLGQEGIFISLIGDVVDANIMDSYNHKIWICRIFVTVRIGGDLMQGNAYIQNHLLHSRAVTDFFILGT